MQQQPQTPFLLSRGSTLGFPSQLHLEDFLRNCWLMEPNSMKQEVEIIPGNFQRAGDECESVPCVQTGLASYNGKPWLWRDHWDETMSAGTGEILNLVNPLNLAWWQHRPAFC